jgi:hypothetical protein
LRCRTYAFQVGASVLRLMPVVDDVGDIEHRIVT